MCKEYSQMVLDMKENPEIGDRSYTVKGTFLLPWNRKDLSLRNIFGLSFAIALFLSSYEGARGIQVTSIGKNETVGDISEITAFTTCMLSLLLFPKMFIRKYGCKITILISMFTFIPFILTAYQPKLWILLTSSILLSIGSGNLCTAVATYLSDRGFSPSRNSCQEKVTACYFGIFFTMIQHRYIWPNAISLCLKRCLGISSTGNFHGLISKGNTGNFIVNNSIVPCEKNCSAILQQKEQPTAIDVNYLLIGIYFIICITAGLFLSYFLDLRLKKKIDDDEDDSMSTNFMATVKHPQYRDLVIMSFISTFVGMQEGFMFEHYIKESPNVLNMGLEYFLFQFGMLSFGMYAFSIAIVFIFPRSMCIITSAITFVFVCLKASEPYTDNMTSFFWVVTVWTIINAIFQIELCVMYSSVFKIDHEAAFSNYFLWVTAGMFLSRSEFSSYITMTMQLAFLAVGMAGYLLVEFRYWRKEAVLDVKPEEDEENLLKEESGEGSLTLVFKMISHKKGSDVEFQFL